MFRVKKPVLAIIEYEVNGTRFRLDGCAFLKKPWGIGTVVRVAYDPKHPNYAVEAVLDDFFDWRELLCRRVGLGALLFAAAEWTAPAFVGLDAPYWDSQARGAIFGITRGTTRAHIARAAVDAIAYQTRDVIEAMRKDSGLSLESIRVDGAATRNGALLQFQADILGAKVLRPVVAETTALGAAYLAGLATSVLADLDDIQRLWALDRTFTPALEAAKRESLYAGGTDAVRRTLTRLR